jgi:hypothetical protein
MRELHRLVSMIGVVLIVAGTGVADEGPLLSPADQATISFHNPARGAFVFMWQAAPGVSEYRLIVSSRADLSVRVVTRVVNSTVSGESAIVRGLGAGSYWWTVEPVGQEPAAPRTVRTFSIKAGTP